MKEEEKIENERVERRNPSTEEKIMLNIPYPKPYISSGFPNWCIIKWGYTPPPIQKLSHGDHWRSSFSPSIPWFYHEISISFPHLFVHLLTRFHQSSPHPGSFSHWFFFGFLHFFLLSVNFIMIPSYCNVCIMHYLYLIYL